MLDFSFDMAKTKNLKKKIRRLEARLQKGAKKLAKLKRKLEEAATTAAVKTEAKSGAPSRRGMKSAITVKEPRVSAKKKRKLNLTPERRAQLAEAMRARWAAKRSATAATTQESPSSPGFALGDSSRPQ